MVIESMADGGVKNGVPRALAYKLVSKSMEGAAKLVLETGNAPGVVSAQSVLFLKTPSYGGFVLKIVVVLC